MAESVTRENTEHVAINYQISGSSGNGFVNMLPQAPNPATPASGIKIYTTSNDFVWRGADSWIRNFSAPVTTNRTYNFPDISGNILTDNSTANITNKTITANSNIVSASQLRTTGADVVISGATPPAVGQILVATTPTTATWQNAPPAALPTTTKGDIIVHNGITDVRLPVGANGTVFISNSGTAEGVEWSTIQNRSIYLDVNRSVSTFGLALIGTFIYPGSNNAGTITEFKFTASYNVSNNFFMRVQDITNLNTLALAIFVGAGVGVIGLYTFPGVINVPANEAVLELQAFVFAGGTLDVQAFRASLRNF